MTRRPAQRELTPLAAIRPPVGGRAALLLAAARRWRRLAGPGTARRLPILEVKEGAWIIGIPSPMWQAELDRLARQAVAQGDRLPRLIGRLVESGPPVQAETRQGSQDAPPPGAGAVKRWRWLMERLGDRDGTS